MPLIEDNSGGKQWRISRAEFPRRMYLYPDLTWGPDRTAALGFATKEEAEEFLDMPEDQFRILPASI